jgi:lactoylglutathione lyase
METIMQFNGIHHIGLWVKDPQKSLDFYTKGLGGKVVFSFPMADKPQTINLVDLGNNAVVEIIPRGNGDEEKDAHWAHIALRVDNAKEAYDRAIKAGAVSRSEPRENSLGTMKVINPFVLGPDHEVIELFQIVSDGSEGQITGDR